MELVLGLVLAGIIGALHLFGDEIDHYISDNNLLLASFSAGFTISYFFLSMLPKMADAVSINQYEFLYALIGFSLFYIVEELIYERESHLNEIKKDFKELHTVFIFSYHFAIGLLLYFLLNQSRNEALLFFLPVMIHTAVNSLAIREMHEEMLDKPLVKIIASFATVFGVIASYMLNPSPSIAYSIFGVIGGMFIYVVVHDALSPKRERPLGFISGVLLFSLLIHII